ncbi:cysteine--tRNA ligase [Candidatus Woesebacteria bacterium RIFOXYC1_FULL_41_14]|uniref:Cysteine--tRNA ligase n=3 Tax=Candidatus Woeseibacteriota TaxID=1752722 RepID=A0A0G0QSS7_9BACT|nr:MAG: Cysteine-tRNA ligase [Candidatus Woesebacteria bacterium GW2011_GWB1_40_12]KKR89961.1 MAG: Cysteine-tRNA ligase [Candidatus Woesebacteria bacterium GW2011_GWD1_41_12]OGM84664.1 MAG: cysteine--tRNA ligase [Candidatus Woesebacteria bacterium RIFOXYC1_FULL_41_14]OGM87354.1 MAG: cysteine--tRNA ligase [Candidatus Woesebacteria bacterium RIFOXYD1_FULL_41_28]
MADIYLTNTLTRKKENFSPLKKGSVGIYSCGPTVYWNQHIGHMYAYVQWDVLVRLLRFQGNEVNWVMNLTDVGHMTSDEDAGEDKMEKGAKREGLTVWQIADKYIKQFTDSLMLLNIKTPDVLCRATDHIEDQIELIKKIEANGFTYKTGTGLVFDTSKFPDYAKFANLNLEDQKAGARTEVDPEKRNPWDFLLWVTNQPNHIMQWDSPWGKGFPGWHIECTAMSTKYLGERFDIHTGGKEHVSVHHTNEIAQGYGAFGHQTADYWLHNEWLLVNGEKMSKSLGNNVLVTDLIEKGFDPLALRYLILTTHYRTGLNFTLESLTAAQTALEKLRNQIAALKNQADRTTLSPEKEKQIEVFRNDFIESLNDDLNVAKAIAIVWSMLGSNIPSADKYDLVMSFDEILGLKLNEAKVVTLPESVKELIEKRSKLRSEGKYEEADKIRDEIVAAGFEVSDKAL